jgi:hypothetical protein
MGPPFRCSTNGAFVNSQWLKSGGFQVDSPWWKSGVSTETGEAPAGQGATTENIRDIRGRIQYPGHGKTGPADESAQRGPDSVDEACHWDVVMAPSRFHQSCRPLVRDELQQLQHGRIASWTDLRQHALHLPDRGWPLFQQDARIASSASVGPLFFGDDLRPGRPGAADAQSGPAFMAMHTAGWTTFRRSGTLSRRVL